MNKLLILIGISLLMVGGLMTPVGKVKALSILLFIVNYIMFFVK